MVYIQNAQQRKPAASELLHNYFPSGVIPKHRDSPLSPPVTSAVREGDAGDHGHNECVVSASFMLSCYGNLPFSCVKIVLAITYLCVIPEDIFLARNCTCTVVVIWNSKGYFQCVYVAAC